MTGIIGGAHHPARGSRQIAVRTRVAGRHTVKDRHTVVGVACVGAALAILATLVLAGTAFDYEAPDGMVVGISELKYAVESVASKWLPGYAYAELAPTPLNLIAADSITDDDALALVGAASIATFEAGGRTYAAVTSLIGVQTLDITDPSHIVAADSLSLPASTSIAIFESSGRTYAAVTSFGDNGVQILDLADPYNIVLAGSISDDDNLTLAYAFGVATFERNGRTYAAVTSSADNGVQILDITNPNRIVAAGSITDGDDLALSGAAGIATFEVGGRTYAAVASTGGSGLEIFSGDEYNVVPIPDITPMSDPGVQILDITNPNRIVAAGHIIDDNDDDLALNGARGITTFEENGRTYTVIASIVDGIQILDVTNPNRIVAAGSIADGDDLALSGAASIATFEAGGRTYAAVASFVDNGVQILDLADPATPRPVASLTDGLGGFDELSGAISVEITEISGQTYAVVTGISDNGVQIIGLTAPAPKNLGGAGGAFEALSVVNDIDITEITGRVYALVASSDGMQVIDITDPTSPIPTSSVSGGMDGFEALDSANGIAIGEIAGRVYALVASSEGMQVIDITDPTSPIPTSSVSDGMDGFEAPGVVIDIAVAEISGRVYALLTNKYNVPYIYSGSTIPTFDMQAIDITNPASPIPAAIGAGYLQSRVPSLGQIATAEISGRAYALVLIHDDVYVAEITDPPLPPSARGQSIFDEAQDVAIAEISGGVYALVGTVDGDELSLFIVDITDPTKIDVLRGFSYEYYAQTPENSVPANNIPTMLEIVVVEIHERIYALALGGGSAHVLDITDPHSYTFPYLLFTYGTDYSYSSGGPIAIHNVAGQAYAVVAIWNGNAVQLFDISDPASTIPVSGTVGGQADVGALQNPRDVAIHETSGRTYALVAGDRAVQIIDITSPASPLHVARMVDDDVTAIVPVAGVSANDGGFEGMRWTYQIDIWEASGRTYALLTSRINNATSQVIDITDPTSPVPASRLTGGQDGFDVLDGVFWDIAIHEAAGRTYALAAQQESLRVIDITDPIRPTLTSNILGGEDGFDALHFTSNIAVQEISGRTYALAASSIGIQVIDITDPAKPTPASGILVGQGGFYDLNMDGGRDQHIAVREISGRTYALAASSIGIQVIDITDPAKPLPGFGFSPDDTGLFLRDGSDPLDHISGMVTTDISGRTYALLISSGVGALQIVDITDPASPVPVARMVDGQDGFTALADPNSITVREVSGRTYALVTSWDDNAIQVIDITDPASPDPASVLGGLDGFDALYDPWDIAIHSMAGRTYALAASLGAVQIMDITDLASGAPATNMVGSPSEE